ncbi:MAG: DUF1559 domain-containing protein, partial [Planctomycetes bacterium]|nr:DUF1559 domain-containing protein [Planctomycetota bacterium]
VWHDIANEAWGIGTNDAAVSDQVRYTECLQTAIQYNGKRYNDTGVNTRTGTRAGERWADGRAIFAGFNTLMQPNGPTCTSAPDAAGDWYDGVWTASSRHPDIVQVGMADGSVRQIPNSININTWRALGTRSRGETLGEF